MIGKIISHYKILEKLGAGGMGEVYQAEDLKLDRFVALKFLSPHFSMDEEGKQRFIQEAKAASALDHPNICTIYEIDETKSAPGELGDGQMFIVMAHYEGETLKEKSKDQRLKIKETVNIAIQIAQGLSKAHEKGIVHRDIKPANIMITKDGIVKILDFGIAKLSGTTILTREGTTKGTVAYMSSEQALGKDVDHRTDIWSLGVLLFEMLSGELPFKGDIDQVVIYSILNKEPESISSLNPDINPGLDQIITKALSKNPDDRYQNSEEILNDLLCLKDGHKIAGNRKLLPILQKLRQRRAFPIFVIIFFLLIVSMILY